MIRELLQDWDKRLKSLEILYLDSRKTQRELRENGRPGSISIADEMEPETQNLMIETDLLRRSVVGLKMLQKELDQLDGSEDITSLLRRLRDEIFKRSSEIKELYAMAYPPDGPKPLDFHRWTTLASLTDEEYHAILEEYNTLNETYDEFDSSGAPSA